MSSRVIGLDLGSSSVKAAQILRHDDGTYVVEHQAARKLPKGVVYDGHIEPARRGRVSSIIAEMFEEEKGFTTKDVIFGLNSSAATFMDEVTVPVMKEEDLAVALPTVLAASNASFDPADNEVSFAVVGIVDTDRGRQMKVLVFRALASYVKDISEVIEAAGLNVVGADFNSLAALRAIETLPRPERQVDAVIDIGANVTTLMLHHNGVPKYLNLDPASAGSVATSKVADALGYDDDDDQAEFEKINNDEQYGLVAQARNEYSKSLADRVARSFANAIERSTEIDSLASVTLVGGGALLAGASWFLKEAFGTVPMTYAKIDPSITGKDGQIRRQEPGSGGDYLVAVGLGTGATL